MAIVIMIAIGRPAAVFLETVLSGVVFVGWSAVFRTETSESWGIFFSNDVMPKQSRRYPTANK
jgi:hypothetical protein